MDDSMLKLTLAHSPDSDDAFMFWALAKGYVRVPGIDFEHTLSDIQSLNQAALKNQFDITAISIHAYPYLAREYSLMNCGASVGDGYGPKIVSLEKLDLKSLQGKIVAIPGSLTTAALTLRLAVPGLKTEEVAFDRVMEAVKNKDVAAGVIIHEGQVTYEDEGLHCVGDLGKWWKEETGLPLPLGANVIKTSLGPDIHEKAGQAIRESIGYGMEHRTDAIGYARDYGRDLAVEKVDEFVSMYVNDYTLDWGETGRRAVRELLSRAADAGIVPAVDEFEFVG
ncbi:ABC transporter substrate-binding protein [bacterium]|nr:ABC transporter substrate-binding protein [bacterium]